MVRCRRWHYLPATQRWPMGLDVSVRPGWTPVWPCWASPEPPDTFSSSLLLRQAAFGFKFRSAGSERQESILTWCDVALTFQLLQQCWDTAFISWTLTSDLLLQAKYDGHSLMKDEQFSLRLLAFQVQLAHATQLLEGLVDVSHPQAFAGVVSHPSFTLAFCLLLRIQLLVFSETVGDRRNPLAVRSILQLNGTHDKNPNNLKLCVCVSTSCVCLLWVSSYPFYRSRRRTCPLWRGCRASRPCPVSPPSAPGWWAPGQPGLRQDLMNTM